MQYAGAAILFAGLAAQQVTAFGWTDASSFSCPGNTNNHCSPQQQGGYDWSSLPTGSFDSYGSNQFSGFQCSDSPGFAKRDLLNKRGFQSKCITGSLDSNPSMSCNDNEGMSIDQMQISSSHDTDIDCEYGMPDGSTCHEIHSCSQGGSVFQNSQCGGAKSVTFKPGKNAPPGCSIGVHSVGFHCGPPSSTVPAHAPSSSPPAPPASSSAPPYHCTGPQCSSAPAPSSSAPVYSCVGPTCSSSVTSPVSSSPPVSSVPPHGCYGPTCSSTAPVSSAPPPPASSVPVPPGSAPPCYGSSCSSSSPVVPIPSSSEAMPCYGSGCGSSTSAQPVTSSSPPVPCYGGSCSSQAVPVPSSSAPVPCYGNSCSSSAAPVPSGSASPPPCYGAACSSSAQPVSSAPSAPCYGAACSSSAQPVSSAPSAPCYGSGCSSTQGIPGYGSSSSPVAPVSSSTAPGPYPTPNCPGLLPRCLNTWMFMSGCKDNADANCFCGSQDFITKVMGCISAWGASDSEVQAAASYLMGLCAPHVSTNPAIITACPSTVTPGPSPAGYTPSGAGPITSAPPPVASTPGKPAPCTTITYSSSVVIPATFSTGVSSGLTCPGSSITTTLVTTVTVPQVAMTTATITTGGTTTQSVGLGAGSPSPVPAYPTSAGAVPTGAGTTFGTSVAATSSASAFAPVPATGAGAKTGFGSITSLILGAIAAIAAL